MANQGSTGSAGRFGARYGRVSRRRVSEIEDEMNDDHACPDCGSDAVSREGTGIWQCGKCGYKYAGGAYTPETPGGRAVSRSIRAALSESDEDVDVPDIDAEDVDAEDVEAADASVADADVEDAGVADAGVDDVDADAIEE